MLDTIKKTLRKISLATDTITVIDHRYFNTEKYIVICVKWLEKFNNTKMERYCIIVIANQGNDIKGAIEYLGENGLTQLIPNTSFTGRVADNYEVISLYYNYQEPNLLKRNKGISYLDTVKVFNFIKANILTN